MGLTADVGLRGVMLGVERVEVLLEPVLGGHAGVRGHHGGIVGHASVAFDGVGPKQEDLRDDRGLAQSSDRGRPSVCLSRRHRAQAQLGRRGAQRLAAGCDRREQARLSGDSRHLRGGEGGQDGLSAFLKHLKERGLKGVRLITSDACIGLAESAAEFFPEAAWQRCVVHWYRPSTKVREIAAMLKAIHASEDIAAAREKAIRVIEKLRGLRLSRAAELVEAAVEETLAYYAFPEEHWRRIRTNNPLERILREIRQRTRVVGIP